MANYENIRIKISVFVYMLFQTLGYVYLFVISARNVKSTDSHYFKLSEPKLKIIRQKLPPFDVFNVTRARCTFPFDTIDSDKASSGRRGNRSPTHACPVSGIRWRYLTEESFNRAYRGLRYIHHMYHVFHIKRHISDLKLRSVQLTTTYTGILP